MEPEIYVSYAIYWLVVAALSSYLLARRTDKGVNSGEDGI